MEYLAWKLESNPNDDPANFNWPHVTREQWPWVASNRLSAFQEIHEARQWCDWHSMQWCRTYGGICFKSRDDAVAFMLRWG